MSDDELAMVATVMRFYAGMLLAVAPMIVLWSAEWWKPAAPYRWLAGACALNGLALVAMAWFVEAVL